MTQERRYHEDEMAEIFEAAATPPTNRAPARSQAEGLTLEELQAIGREVGVAPERIAAAAAALELRRAARPRKSDLGMPISVGRSFDLPRAPNDHEWGMLVAEIRETFGARGKMTSDGALREWRNGNLRVEIEPTESAHRIRMSTRKNDAVATNQMAIAALIGALILLAINFFLGGDEFFAPTFISAIAAALLAANAVRLPRWALEREEQMEYIGARALELIKGDATPENDAALTP